MPAWWIEGASAFDLEKKHSPPSRSSRPIPLTYVARNLSWHKQLWACLEAANQSLIVEVISLVSKRATMKGDAEFTTDIISTTNVGSKSIEQGFDSCKRIFRTVRKKFSAVI